MITVWLFDYPDKKKRRKYMQAENKMAVTPIGKLICQMSVPPLISMF